jgi:CTP:molybdopterin cytidylyltransferase MocA
VCGPALRALTGDKGAREVVAKHAALHLPVQDLGCVLDVDTPQALAHASTVLAERIFSSD